MGVFPSAESYVRLISCYLLEYSEDWLTERGYVRKEAIGFLSQSGIQLPPRNGLDIISWSSPCFFLSLFLSSW